MDGGLSLRKPPDSLKGRAYSLRPAPRKGRYSTPHRNECQTDGEHERAVAAWPQ